jgi:exopolyphosphatase/pppGpp-phosphohydrolase
MGRAVPGRYERTRLACRRITLWTSVALLLMVVATGAQPAQPNRTCAIDMGSNTFRRIVASFAGGRYTPISLDKKALGVGDDVTRNGRVSDAKLAEIDATLREFKAACVKDGLPKVVAVGTAAFRDAANGSRVVEIASQHQIDMEIATAERESTLAYLVGSLGEDGLAVIDNGSRTIELVAQQGGVRQHSVSNLGYRVAYEQFFASAKDASAAVARFRQVLGEEATKATFMRGRKKLVGVEFGDMIEVLFEKGAVEGRVLSTKDLKGKLDEITRLDEGGFAALKLRNDIDRALPRLVAATVFTEMLGYDAIELTGRELGAGLIIEAGQRR